MSRDAEPATGSVSGSVSHSSVQMKGAEMNSQDLSSTDVSDGEQSSTIVPQQNYSSVDSNQGSARSHSAVGENQYEGEAGLQVELMLAYKAGDKSAFEKLYRMYQPKLYRFFLSATGTETVALDLYQETWTKVIRARDAYQPKALFSTWIFTIARNCLNDHYRVANKPVNQLPDADEVDSAMNQLATDDSDGMLAPDEIASLAQRAEYLQQALKLLPDEQQDVVLLRYAADMSIAEIAILNNENPETIKSRLRYALPKLRSSLRSLERGL